MIHIKSQKGNKKNDILTRLSFGVGSFITPAKYFKKGETPTFPMLDSH
jgi:hypothetical protein